MSIRYGSFLELENKNTKFRALVVDSQVIRKAISPCSFSEEYYEVYTLISESAGYTRNGVSSLDVNEVDSTHGTLKFYNQDELFLYNILASIDSDSMSYYLSRAEDCGWEWVFDCIIHCKCPDRT